MNTILKSKLEGMEREMTEFTGNLRNFNLTEENLPELERLIQIEMQNLNFESVDIDQVGNIIGKVKGFQDNGDIVMIANLDLPLLLKQNENRNSAAVYELFENDKEGIITSLYTGALLMRATAPLRGNVYVCCITRSECCGYGIRHLFNNVLDIHKIKGIILCEPTDYDVYLGNKGRLEYEIIVHDYIQNNFSIDQISKRYNDETELLNRLNRVSESLPADSQFGRSTLNIKDIMYKSSDVSVNENIVRVNIDRMYVPYENRNTILQNAKSLAESVYKSNSANIETSVNEDMITTRSGKQIREIKEYKPWKMEGQHPFVVNTLEVLKENQFTPSIGYWKKIITEGSFTNGELNIPTIGFGAGKGESAKGISVEELKKSIFGKALIIFRQIGMHTFGWDENDI